MGVNDDFYLTGPLQFIDNRNPLPRTGNHKLIFANYKLVNSVRELVH